MDSPLLAKANQRAQGESGPNYAIPDMIVCAGRKLGERSVLKFLEDVPESGQALWARYHAFQMGTAGVDFSDFIEAVLAGSA